MIFVYNGKFGGGRMLLNPPGILNDGYFEFFMYYEKLTTPEFVHVFDQAKDEGQNFYCPMGRYLRVKKLRLENQTLNSKQEFVP